MIDVPILPMASAQVGEERPPVHDVAGGGTDDGAAA